MYTCQDSAVVVKLVTFVWGFLFWRESVFVLAGKFFVLAAKCFCFGGKLEFTHSLLQNVCPVLKDEKFLKRDR